MDTENVVQYRCFQNIVNSAQIELGAITHGENLPVASTITRHSSEISASVLLNILTERLGGLEVHDPLALGYHYFFHLFALKL